MDRYDPYTDKFLRDTQYNIHGTNLASLGTDCISRRAAIDIAKDLTITVKGYEMHNQAVMNYCAEIIQLPPIQPEIVRCKDCKHWIPYDWMFSEMWQSKNISDYPEDEISCNYCDVHMKSSDFCSQAVRREVQDENDKTTNNTTNA